MAVDACINVYCGNEGSGVESWTVCWQHWRNLGRKLRVCLSYNHRHRKVAVDACINVIQSHLSEFSEQVPLVYVCAQLCLALQINVYGISWCMQCAVDTLDFFFK